MRSASGNLSEWLGLIRFSHTIFALPFAAIATLLAFEKPLADSGEFPQVRWQDLLGVLACMVTARSAAMAFNRWADRDVDARNPRTASRHIPAGRLSGSSVVWFTAIMAGLFVASTLLFLPNPLPVLGSPFVLAILLGYSYAKRFTDAAQVWLGVALAISPICAWVAIRGTQSGLWWTELALPLSLAFAVAFWVAGFDTIYACQDEAFDREARLRSLPVRFGISGSLTVAKLLHLAMLAALAVFIYIGTSVGFGIPMVVIGTAVAVLVIYQHALVRPDDLSRVGIAFFNTNAVISVVLLMGTIVDVWLL